MQQKEAGSTLAMRLIIEGRVQGVGYRAWAVAEAQALGLKGWVRNREDGKVEMLIDGPLKQMVGFVAYCQDGPPAARVTKVTTHPVEDDESIPAEFAQLPTH